MFVTGQKVFYAKQDWTSRGYVSYGKYVATVNKVTAKGVVLQNSDGDTWRVDKAKLQTWVNKYNSLKKVQNSA